MSKGVLASSNGKKIMSELIDELDKQEWDGFISPSAVVYIEKQIKSAMDRGVVRSQREALICASALFLAGREEAVNKRKSVIDEIQVRRGWYRLREQVAVARSHPRPYECLQRTVLNRVEELENSLPGFKRMIDTIGKPNK